ncbi:MAG TPA: hypothetical protein DCF84_03255 [Bacteroidetes bacterium]|nr:hypothetical protein [Bacteroidota bacterium]
MRNYNFSAPKFSFMPLLIRINPIIKYVSCFLISFFMVYSGMKAQDDFGGDGQACKDQIQYYRSFFSLDCVEEKATDNYGNGFSDLYGTRNFRTILHGVAYRGGGNNYYHNENKRDNKNPLPNDGLKNLADLKFEAAVYLYSTNFETAPSTMRGSSGHVMDYYQISGNSKDDMRSLLEMTHESIMNPDQGPLYLHCWNGWHQSGYVSAVLLRQFCGLSAEEGLQYWNNNTDTYNNGYTRIKNAIQDFQPYQDLKVSGQVQKEICPCMNSMEVSVEIDDAVQKKLQNTLMVKVPFESNSSAITPGSLTVIDEYIVLLKENKFFDVEIGGHSSAPGDFYANQVLSEKRAKLVYEYLIAEGIESERLTYRGYGESQLLDIRNTQEAHDKNRRIEFNVIGLNLEVQFAKNSSRLPQSAESQLLFVREMLAANPTYAITIVGHTDISGDADINQRLSRERAYAVYEYLQRTGASTDQLFYKGMGADQPRYSNDTELGRSKNRRIEIILN